MDTSLDVTDMAPIPLIDTHCHLDDHQFDSDLDQVLENSRAANVTRWILIGYDPARWSSAIHLAGKHDGMFHTVGVHPSCAVQWNDDIAESLRTTADTSGAVAIGEAGLDFYRDNAALEIQAEAFRGQLGIAHSLGWPLVIHMRNAEQQMLEILRSATNLPTLIFHSFDGGEPLMDFALNTGSYVGVGGLATRQKSDKLRALLKRVPMDRILLETDSPYLVPARQKDRRNQPAHVATIASMMAGHFGISLDRLAVSTTTNAVRVFGLPDD